MLPPRPRRPASRPGHSDRCPDLRQVDAELERKAAGDRAHSRFRLGVRAWRCRRRGRRYRRRRGCRRARLERRIRRDERSDEAIHLGFGHLRVGEHTDQRPHRAHFARRTEDSSQHTGDRCLHRVHDLVGLDLEQRVALVDRLSGREVPGRHGPFLHLDAPLRHRDRMDGSGHFITARMAASIRAGLGT